VAQAEFRGAEGEEALVGHALVEQLADRAVHHAERDLARGEPERQADRLEFGHGAAAERHPHPGHRQRPLADIGDVLARAAELHRREGIDQRPAAGQRLDLLPETLDRDRGGVLGREIAGDPRAHVAWP
jgi:hypothetical protein